MPYVEHDDLKYELTDVFDLFSYINPLGFPEKFMFIVRDFFGLSEEEIDENASQIRKELKGAFDWYKKYLKKEDANEFRNN
ncbi:hypothetical protein ACQ1PF_08050 [Ornithobacterium rhinotracheale]